MLTFILVILFFFIVFLNAAVSLKSNWAFFYDTKMFRNFFPYKIISLILPTISLIFFKNKAASSCLILPHFKNLSFVTLIISREIIDKAKITKRE